MIGVIIVCHGTLASSLLHSAELFFGELDRVAAIDFELNDGILDLKTRLEQAILQVASPRIILLTDLMGGSPTNICIEILKCYPHIDLFTGANLPMLLEILFNRTTQPPDQVVQSIIPGTQKGIINYREFLKGGRLV